MIFYCINFNTNLTLFYSSLTAIPKKVVITSDQVSEYSEAYRISWTVWSASQLVSNKILLRMVSKIPNIFSRADAEKFRAMGNSKYTSHNNCDHM